MIRVDGFDYMNYLMINNVVFPCGVRNITVLTSTVLLLNRRWS